MIKLEVWKDLDTYKNKEYNKKFDKIYRTLPITECDGCGNCCYDPPILTYVEFLYAFDYILSLKWNKDSLVHLYKSLIKRKFLGLIQREKCCFIDENNLCIIHKVSPLACKRWGLQPESQNLSDWESDLQNNIKSQMFFKEKGIDIPDEKINSKTEYCKRVRIIKNKYRFVYKDFDPMVYTIVNMTRTFADKNREMYDICDYMLAIFFDELQLAYDRIYVLKEYQSGNINSVDEYINNIDFEQKLLPLFLKCNLV